MKVLKCTAAQHGATINELAERGVIEPVRPIVYHLADKYDRQLENN